MIHALVSWFGAVGGGGEESPLSVNSSLAEIIRVLQFGIVAGILYLINLAKKSLANRSDKVILEKLDGIESQVTGVKDQVTALDARVSKLEGNGVH